MNQTRRLETPIRSITPFEYLDRAAAEFEHHAAGVGCFEAEEHDHFNLKVPADQWKAAVVNIPKRKHQHVRYLDERINLKGYEGEIRQIVVTGLGRERPTLFLTNNFEVTPRDLIINYARRNGITNRSDY